MEEVTREPRKRGPKPKAERDSHENTARPPRIPLQSGGKLHAEKRPGYQRYWAIDKPGMIEKMKAAWWTHVLDETTKQPIKVPAGSSGTHYLMEIEQKYYDEDMAKQQELINEATRDAAKVGEGEYIPEGNKGVLTREVIVEG